MYHKSNLHVHDIQVMLHLSPIPILHIRLRFNDITKPHEYSKWRHPRLHILMDTNLCNFLNYIPI